MIERSWLNNNAMLSVHEITSSLSTLPTDPHTPSPTVHRHWFASTNTLPPPLRLQESPIRLEGLPLISSTMSLEVAVEVGVSELVRVNSRSDSIREQLHRIFGTICSGETPKSTLLEQSVGWLQSTSKSQEGACHAMI
jgi:hypothetical protein